MKSRKFSPMANAIRLANILIVGLGHFSFLFQLNWSGKRLTSFFSRALVKPSEALCSDSMLCLKLGPPCSFALGGFNESGHSFSPLSRITWYIFAVFARYWIIIDFRDWSKCTGEGGGGGPEHFKMWWLENIWPTPSNWSKTEWPTPP